MLNFDCMYDTILNDIVFLFIAHILELSTDGPQIEDKMSASCTKLAPYFLERRNGFRLMISSVLH